MPETDDRPRITDPQRLRALAHPLRNELMDVLAVEVEATATRCAELTRESVASCSFHLRMLAKYGFIEPAPQSGREKPWRLVNRSYSTSADLDDQASIHAAQDVATFVVEREAQRLREWIQRAPVEPVQWRDAAVLSSSVFWATSAELAELTEQLTSLTDRFKERWNDPSTRPDGARVVRLFGATTVDPDRPSSSTDDAVDASRQAGT